MSELCLKDKKVLTIKDVDGKMSSIIKIDNPELLPLCLKDDCTIEKLMDWLAKRGMPDSREGLHDVTEQFGTEWRTSKNYQSLSDQYWIRRRSENWKKINFFNNLYSRDIGDMFFAPWDISKKKIDNFSPDITTNGVLRKRWIQDNEKKSKLIKAGSRATKQEPLNEVLVSVMAEKINKFSCVKYDLWIEGSTMCSICDNFITEDTELVPAHYIYDKESRNENETVMNHLLKMCEKYDIPNAEEHIRWILFVDRITCNGDRNLGNISFIRDSNTQKFLGPAPMYDSGNAYWNTDDVGNSVKSKFFGNEGDDFFKKMKQQGVLEFLVSDTDYIESVNNLIFSYPEISDKKKTNLVEAIKKRNYKLCRANFTNIGGR